MTDSLGVLNGLDFVSAQRALTRCVGSSRWAEMLTEARPFEDLAAVHEAADRTAGALEETDWLEAFASHPPIGSAPTGRGAQNRWSRQEQSGMDGSSDELRTEMVRLNLEYAERFGFVFLICATGRSAIEMRDALRQRLQHDRSTEVAHAIEEQKQIAALRLARLVEGESTAPTAETPED